MRLCGSRLRGDPAPALPDLSLLCVWGAHRAPLPGLLVLVTAGGRSPSSRPALPCLCSGPTGGSAAPALDPRTRAKPSSLSHTARSSSENWTGGGLRGRGLGPQVPLQLPKAVAKPGTPTLGREAGAQGGDRPRPAWQLMYHSRLGFRPRGWKEGENAKASSPPALAPAILRSCSLLRPRGFLQGRPPSMSQPRDVLWPWTCLPPV